MDILPLTRFLILLSFRYFVDENTVSVSVIKDREFLGGRCSGYISRDLT